jgi:hypothetical protein
LVRKILMSLGSILADAQERSLVAHNAVRELRCNRKGHHAEKRQKGTLKVSVDISTPGEVKAIIDNSLWTLASTIDHRDLHWAAHRNCLGCGGAR